MTPPRTLDARLSALDDHWAGVRLALEAYLMGIEDAANVPVTLGKVGDKSSTKVMTMHRAIQMMRDAIRALAAKAAAGGEP